MPCLSSSQTISSIASLSPLQRVLVFEPFPRFLPVNISRTIVLMRSKNFVLISANCKILKFTLTVISFQNFSQKRYEVFTGLVGYIYFH